jgi:hypothetical protein
MLKKTIGMALISCILSPDPTPLGDTREKAPPSLIPLIPDLVYPPTPLAPKWLYDGPIDLLPPSSFARARLDTGTKLEGVSLTNVDRGIKERVLTWCSMNKV